MATRTRPATDPTERRGEGPAPRRRALRCALLASALAAAFGLAPTPAEAQSFGPSGCCAYADNSNHTFFYSNVVTANINAMEYARATRLESTVMTTDRFESSNNDTDVIVYDGSWPTNQNAAWWQCDLYVSGNPSLCNRGRIVINQSWGNANTALTCQEVGHSVGLDHSGSTGSCMFQNSSVASNNYDAHDRSHIDGYYL